MRTLRIIMMVLSLLAVFARAGAEEPAPGPGTDAVAEPGLITREQFIDALRIKTPDGDYSKQQLHSVSDPERPQAKVTVNILFKSGSTELADDFSVRQVEEAGQALSSDVLAGYYFEIAGHTDNVGSEETNLKLSQERARAIRALLIRFYGISPERLFARGYGESLPVAANTSEAGRAKNRRVVFIRIDRPEQMIKDLEKQIK